MPASRGTWMVLCERCAPLSCDKDVPYPRSQACRQLRRPDEMLDTLISKTQGGIGHDLGQMEQSSPTVSHIRRGVVAARPRWLHSTTQKRCVARTHRSRRQYACCIHNPAVSDP